MSPLCPHRQPVYSLEHRRCSLRRETMAALSMSAASISFGRNVADARALRVSVRLPPPNAGESWNA